MLYVLRVFALVPFETTRVSNCRFLSETLQAAASELPLSFEAFLELAHGNGSVESLGQSNIQTCWIFFWF